MLLNLHISVWLKLGSPQLFIEIIFIPKEHYIVFTVVLCLHKV